MGTFLGHAVPGTFFFSFGLWWTYSVLKRHNRAKVFGEKFKTSSSFTLSCVPKLPIEGILKTIVISIGIIGESIGLLDGSIKVHNVQHIIMYSFFLFTAIVDINNSRKDNWLLPDLDYITCILAFTVEAFIFAWHLHGRPNMDIQVHSFLLYSIYICLAGVSLEMCFRHDIRPVLLRCWGTLLQGTWFWQTGSILYTLMGSDKRNPAWADNDHEQMMIVTILFTLHLGGCLLLILSIAWFIKRRPTHSGLQIFHKKLRNSFEDEEENYRDEFDYKREKDINFSVVPIHGYVGTRTEKTLLLQG